MSAQILTNTTDLQTLLRKANSLPDVVAFPELTDPGTASDLLAGKELIDADGNVVTGSMPTVTPANPSISVNSSGAITVTVEHGTGYIGGGTTTATEQLTTQAAKTVTPTISDQTAVESGMYTTGVVTVEGDENLIAENIKSGVNIFGVEGSFEGEGSGSGNTEIEDAMVMGTISTYSNDRVTSIKVCAFSSCTSLTSVDFPAVTSIGANAFFGCSYLKTISFPNCTSLDTGAFRYCSGLISVNFPACKSIGGYGLYQCGSLTTVNFPVCTTISNYAFYNCWALTSTSFPVCATIGSYAFYNCSSLASVNFPACKTIGSSAFMTCHSLASARFPACTTINSYAFSGCYALSALYLAGSSVCTLKNVNVFSSTPFRGYKSYFSGTPYIYVPSSLIASYQAASVWYNFSSYFSAIENAPQ